MHNRVKTNIGFVLRAASTSQAVLAGHLVCLAACLVLAAGCGSRRCPTVPVSGRVTLDGKPVPNVHVVFQPMARGDAAANQSPDSFGVTDAEGRFRLAAVSVLRQDGAVVGQHVVRVMFYRPEKPARDDDTHVRPPDNSLPPQAGDGSLRFQVPPSGTKQADFNLTSQPASTNTRTNTK